MRQKDEIKRLLRERGISQASISRNLGLSQTIVMNVINGKSRSKKVEEAITKLTGYEFPKTFKSDEEVKELLKGVI